MASSPSCGETKQGTDFSSLISKGKVDEEVLKDYARNGQIDLADKDGKTPLMIACLHGLTQTVQSLLANGADPNSRNVKDGNTPMHYACMVEEPQEEYALSGNYYRPSKWMAAKLAITKVLVGHGAETVQDNQDGWSPVCVASLYLLTDVVDFLLSKDNVSLEIKIKAMDILGVSQGMSNDRYKLQEAFHSFSRAMAFRQESGLSEPQRETSELAECFSKLSLKECNPLEEIESNKASTIAMKANAFLFGERIFPNKMKHNYLYPCLIRFGSYLMFDLKMCEEGFQILSNAIRFEGRDELKLGSVVLQLAQESGSFLYAAGEPYPPFRQFVGKLISAYESILGHVSIDSILDSRKPLIESFGEILFNEAFYCSTIKIMKSLLQAVEKSLTVIQARILKENSDRYPETPSVTFKVMELLGEAFVEYMYREMPCNDLFRVKFIIFRILLHDNASYKDTGGCNILHLVTSCVQCARNLDYLMDLARVFVRHGCPVDVVNNDGETPYSILEEYVYKIDPEFLMLVSPPMAVLRLEELAIRTVLRHHINYRDKLPSSLCEMVEGGVKECEIERF